MTDTSEPTVTVIIPAYNASATLPATLSSVEAQTFSSFECWIVDDGSTDDTATIARNFAARDARFNVLSQSNKGVARARNAALAKARGQFIAALDADDLWHPDFLRHHVAVLSSSTQQLGFTYCLARTIDSNDRVTGTVFPYMLNGMIVRAVRYHNVIGNPSMTVFRREAVIEAGGYDHRLQDQGCEGSEDWLLLLKVATAWPVQVIPLYLSGYRVSPQSMSADRIRMAQSCRLAEQLYAAEYTSEALPLRVENWQRSMALLQRSRRDFNNRHMADSVKSAISAIALDPLQIAALCADVAVRTACEFVLDKGNGFAQLDPTTEYRSHRSQRPFCHHLRSRRLNSLLRYATA